MLLFEYLLRKSIAKALEKSYNKNRMIMYRYEKGRSLIVKRTTESYPLSGSQRNIWGLEQHYRGTSINNICQTIRIRGTFDIALLQQCLNLLLESDGSLRAQIVLDEEGNPVQYQAEYETQQFPVFDFSTTNQAGIEHWEYSVTREVMPVLDAPLYYFAIIKISEQEGGVLLKTHHLISDGWSQVSLINKLAGCYLDLISGREAVLKPAPGYEMCIRDRKMGAPVIGLVDCAGLRLQEATDALNAFGQIYLSQVQASGVIPQITAVLGTCGGGMAVVPALTDFTFMETKSGKLFLNSPNAIDGNEISKCNTSSAAWQEENTGEVDMTGDEADLINSIRTLISILPANNEDDMSYDECTDDLNRACENLEAVSYTHLDVYKRQVLCRIGSGRPKGETQQCAPHGDKGGDR